MNHINIYNLIIANAKSENRTKFKKGDANYIYYELHHIIPRCVGGEDNEANLILLTTKEHYVAHKLLVHIYSGNFKIVCAFYYMTFNKRQNRRLSSRDYVLAKELFFITSISEETRLKMSASQKNKKPCSIETREKISKANSGKTVSNETKLLMSMQAKGDKNPAKKPESRLNISKKLKGMFIGEKNPMAGSSRKRLKEGDTYEYLRRKIECTNTLTDEIVIYDGVQSLLKSLNISKGKYYGHLKTHIPILDIFSCKIL